MVVVDKPSSAEILGSTLGTGLGQGLQALMNYKMQNIQRGMRDKTMQMMGFSPQESSFINLFGPKEQPKILDYLNRLRVQRQIENEYKSGGEEQPEQQPQQDSGMGLLMNQFGGNAAYQPTTSPYQAMQALGAGGIRPELVQQKPQEQAKKASAGMTKQGYADALMLAGMTPAQRQKAISDAKKLEWQKEKEAIRQDERLRKEKEEYVDTIRNQYKTSEENSSRYRNIIKSFQAGARSGDMQSAMDKLHVGNFFRDPLTQDAQAEINALALGVGTAFGKVGRILGKEFESYKDSLVRIWNTPEGAVLIGWNELLKQQATKARYDSYRQIMKENNNKTPVDLENQIDDRVTPTLKKISDQMDKNLNIAMGGKMPEWGQRDLNPSLYDEGTEADIDGNEYVIKRGMWVPAWMEI